ncbi:MAG: hypothetical protein HYR51_08075 [Candidatus Rokubacteria bacterium]|nr:hypothetical protein [Candidatus Rokubacteria bacterium]
MTSIDVYIGDGYENEYEEFTIRPADVTGVLQQTLYADGRGVPPIMLRIRNA